MTDEHQQVCVAVFGLPNIEEPERDADLLATFLPGVFIHLLDATPLDVSLYSADASDSEAEDELFDATPRHSSTISGLFGALGGVSFDTTVVLGDLQMRADGVDLDLRIHHRHSRCPAPNDGLPATQLPYAWPGEPLALRLDWIRLRQSLLDAARALGDVLGLHLIERAGSRVPASREALVATCAALAARAALSGLFPEDRETPAEAWMTVMIDAIELDPDCGLALDLLGTSLFECMESGDLDSETAERIAARAFAANPTDSQACFDMSDALCLVTNKTASRAWHVRALILENPPLEALSRWIHEVEEAEDLELARAPLRRCVEAGDDLWGDSLLGTLHFRLGEDALAWAACLSGLRRLLDQARRSSEWPTPSYPRHELLTLVRTRYADSGSVAESIMSAMVELAGVLESPEERAELGRFYFTHSLFDLAEPELRAAAECPYPIQRGDLVHEYLHSIADADFPQNFAALCQRARHDDDPSAAAVELLDLIRRTPNYGRVRHFAALALRRLGRFDESMELLVEVRAMNFVGDFDVLLELAEAFHASREIDKALASANLAIFAKPESPEGYWWRAGMLHKLGRSNDALHAIREALRLAPGDVRYQRLQRRLAAE